MSDVSDPEPISDELTALRAENERLRSKLEGPGPQTTPSGSKRRRIGSMALAVVGGLLIPLSILTVWTRNQVLDTDRYVENIAPLASDPAVQAAVSKAVTKQIVEAANLKQLFSDALPGRSAILAGPIASGAETLVGNVTDKAVKSEAFEKIWRESNRIGHKNLVALMTGEYPADSAVQQVDDGKVVLQLGPLSRQVLRSFDRATGLRLSAQIPVERLNVRYVLVDSADLASVQVAIRWLNRLSWFVPLLAIACLVGSVLLADNRRRGIRRVGFTFVIAIVLTRLGLDFGRDIYLTSIPPGTIPTNAATAVFDILTRFVLQALRMLFVVGLVLVAGAWISGPSASALWLRRLWDRALGRSGSGIASVADLGATPRWISDHLGAIRTAILAAGTLVLVTWTHPTGKVVFALALCCLIAIGVAQLLAGAGRAPSDESAPPDALTD